MARSSMPDRTHFDGVGHAGQDPYMALRPWSAWSTLLLLLAVSACGLRTDPDSTLVCVDDDDSMATGTGGFEPRIGSCLDPFDLPLMPLNVQGQIGGCSDIDGWCGGSGPEDVYRLITTVNPIDVTVDFRPDQTTIDPVMRVVRSPIGEACAEAAIIDQGICAPIVNELSKRHFLIEVGFEYYLIVDSGHGEAGEYGFDITYGVGPLVENECFAEIEEQQINLGLGGQFVWEASLDDGQGILDGFCGGPGAEAIFAVNTTSAGTLVASVLGDSGLEPMLSVRPACAAGSELNCDSSTAQLDHSANLAYAVPGATTVYLVVDQLGVEGGSYTLNVGYQ
jgi:hypothetical protein